MSTFGWIVRFSYRTRTEMENNKDSHKRQVDRKHELNEVAGRFIDRIRENDEVGAAEIADSFEEVMRQVEAGSTLRPMLSRRLWLSVASVAAVVAILWGAYWWTQQRQPASTVGLDSSLLSQMSDSMWTDKIVLNTGSRDFILNDDATVSYNDEGAVTVDRLQLADETVDDEDGQALNRLLVPYGTHADVTLSDGTRICVNAGSKLIYPRTFEGKKREVLLEGEAYLEVASNAEMPFVVKTNGMDIRVLGTSFNVQAYRDAEDASVVLAWGSVEVNMGGDTGNRVLLKPSERFVKDGQGFRVDEVDVAEYISWKDNFLLVRGKPVGTIFRQLERFYGCRIHVDSETAERLLSGKLNLAADVREVVESICLSLSLSYQCVSEKEFNIETVN